MQEPNYSIFTGLEAQLLPSLILEGITDIFIAIKVATGSEISWGNYFIQKEALSCFTTGWKAMKDVRNALKTGGKSWFNYVKIKVGSLFSKKIKTFLKLEKRDFKGKIANGVLSAEKKEFLKRIGNISV